MDWRVRYDDGSVVEEGPRAYLELDRTRPYDFDLFLNGELVRTWHVDVDERLWWRRRIRQPVMSEAPMTTMHLVAHGRRDRGPMHAWLFTLVGSGAGDFVVEQRGDLVYDPSRSLDADPQKWVAPVLGPGE